MNKHYLIHIPHSSTYIPTKYMKDYFLDEKELQHNIIQYADIFTDELFGEFLETFGGVRSDYSRLFFDPERFGNDSEESMFLKYKLGWFYENAILEKKPLRSTINKDEVRIYFDKHHKMLNQLTKNKLKLYGKCTILDCHSFSNEKYWFHDEVVLPDICIGFENFHKDSFLVDKIKETFNNYDIKINEPYFGSLVPTNYWNKNNKVKSVMIELNKRLYLEDDNVTKNKNYETIKNKIRELLYAIS